MENTGHSTVGVGAAYTQTSPELSLLGTLTRVEVPFVRVTIGEYTFGVYDKTTGTYTSATEAYRVNSVKYPNYVKSLNITTMKKVLLSIVVCVFAATISAQVTSNPSPIPVGYEGKIVLTFDPTLGTGGMAKATECYSHIGLITASSKNISDWKYIKDDAWGTTTEPKWTADGSKWTYTINNMYTFFGCPKSDTIKYIVMVFHNGKGDSSLEGKSTTTNNGDILVGIGSVVKADIWEGFTPANCYSSKWGSQWYLLWR